MKATVHLESKDLIAITETWWDESHDWKGLLIATGYSGMTAEEGEVNRLPSTSRNG